MIPRIVTNWIASEETARSRIEVAVGQQLETGFAIGVIAPLRFVTEGSAAGSAENCPMSAEQLVGDYLEGFTLTTFLTATFSTSSLATFVSALDTPKACTTFVSSLEFHFATRRLSLGRETPVAGMTQMLYFSRFNEIALTAEDFTVIRSMAERVMEELSEGLSISKHPARTSLVKSVIQDCRRIR